EIRKKTLHLITVPPQEYIFAVYLTPAEQQQLKNRRKMPVAIKREAGTLILNTGNRKGDFEFIPNEAYRSKLNQLGLGDENFDVDTYLDNRTFINVALRGNEINELPTKDEIWLRYFSSGINDDYIALLRRNGYTNAELQDLWFLAATHVDQNNLRRILANNKRKFTDRPPLKDFRLLYFQPLPFSPSQTADFPMPYAEYKAQHPIDSTGIFTLKFPESIMLPDSVMAPLFPRNARAPFELITTGKIADTLRTENLDKLKVKGRIRLYLDESVPEGQIILYKKEGDYLSVKRRSNRLIITNECSSDNVDITANPNGIKSFVTGKCAIMFSGGEDE
ncbi:MAG: hypothetical protein AAF597_08400, partial [Bacteroidota bacterium]